MDIRFTLRWRLAAFPLLLLGPAIASAQGWIEYPSRQDLFWINFPGEPEVRQTTWDSEYGAKFPARIHLVEGDGRRFAVTVVDYTDAERIHTQMAKDCPDGAETCAGGSPATTGVGYWRNDVQGSMAYAASKFLMRDVEVTHFLWNFTDLVEGLHLYLTNPDQSRTNVAIYLHRDRLYFLEATLPKGALGVEIFQQSLRFLDEEGGTVRYERIYHNSAPAPPRVQAANPGDIEGFGR